MAEGDPSPRDTLILRCIKILSQCYSASVLTVLQEQALFMSFYGWYENTETIFLAMEYFPLGDLSGHIRNINEEDEIVSIVRQLVSALNVSHKHNIVHRDINPRVAFPLSVSPFVLICA